MSKLGTGPTAAAIGLYDSGATQHHELGAQFTDKFGRRFRYAKAGASNLVAGNCLQGPAEITTHQVMTPSAAAIGATSVSVTLGATNAVTANQYAGGFLLVDTTPGNGYAYAIKSHPAASASAAVVITLDEPIKVALSTASRLSLTRNPYSGVIQAPVTTLTGVPVGVAVHPIAASEFGWIQVGGLAPMLIAGTPAVGSTVGLPGSAAGAAVIDGAATSGLVIVGVVAHVGADTLNKPTLINFA